MATKQLQLMGVRLVDEEDYGKSAFEIAQDHGFKGTEEEWLESLRGASGVYVGSGEMPEDCNVQIDPDGEPATMDEIIDALLVKAKPYIDEQLGVIENGSY